MEQKLQSEITLYTLKVIDQSISPEEFEKLNSLIMSDQQAARHYNRVVLAVRNFQDNGKEIIKESLQQPVLLKNDFWEKMANDAKTAPTVEIPKEKPANEDLQVQPPQIKRKLSKFDILVLANVAAVILLFVFFRFLPPKSGVETATLVDSINAKWENVDGWMETGTRLSTRSDIFTLKEGLAELKFDNNAKVVIEAPAEFELLSHDQINLITGRIYATVPQEAIGFTVNTPTSRIIDLGTEFGVETDPWGQMQLHVVKGKTALITGDKFKKVTLEVTQGQAKKVSGSSQSASDVAFNNNLFTRKIDSKNNLVWKGQKAIRLADLLMGGNGFGTATKSNIEYDPANGNVVQVGRAKYREGAGLFNTIAKSKYLDSIFVPQKSEDGTVVTSQGHRFKECPETTGLYCSNIVCKKGCSYYSTTQNVFEQSKQQYRDSSFFYMHSNIGLTIDIDAIRSQFPVLRITSFSAFAGILKWWNDESEYSDADIWVLVDGKTRFHKESVHTKQGYDINIPLTDSDRFLTIIVTDGGEVYTENTPANHYDTCGIAEPVFNVE